MRVVVAPDKFKGSLTAAEAAQAIAAGVRDADPTADVSTLPVADGGEGTLEAALEAGYGRHDHEVTGPTGQRVQAALALSRDGTTAVVELAAASGLMLLDSPAPLTAGTRGTGELVRYALDAGARTLVIAIGGSAGSDGGAGLLSALGARSFDADGREIGDGGAALRDITRLDLDGLDPRLPKARVLLACDVDNPLVGPRGSATVFGPQKGATPDDVRLLDDALTRWADVVGRATGNDHRDTPGAGAAGGTGLAALAVLDAHVVPGVEVVLDLVDFDGALDGADLVVTGEGRFDAQSLGGKAPVGVARRAMAAGVPVVVLAGSRERLDDDTLRRAGIVAVHDLSEIEPDPDRRMTDAAAAVRRLAAHAFTPPLPSR